MSCPANSQYTSCSQNSGTNILCLTINNFSGEPVIVLGGGQNNQNCNTIAPDSSMNFSAFQGENFTVTGQQSNILYNEIQIWTANYTVDVFPVPWQVPFYNKDIPGIILPIVTVGWVVLTTALIILRKKNNNKLVTDCITTLGEDKCFFITSKGKRKPLALPGTISSAFVWIAVLIAIALIVLLLVQKGIMGPNRSNFNQCQNRVTAGNWQWTSEYPENYSQGVYKNKFTKFLFGWIPNSTWSSLCKTFGICNCRSLVQERNCDAFGKISSNNQTYYDYTVANSRDLYCCPCVSLGNKDKYNCAAQSLGSSCTPCTGCG